MILMIPVRIFTVRSGIGINIAEKVAVNIIIYSCYKFQKLTNVYTGPKSATKV